MLQVVFQIETLVFFMPYLIENLTPQPSICPVTYTFRESILSVIFREAYEVLAQLNCGEKIRKKLHLCQFLTLSYLVFSGENGYFSYKSEIAVKGKNSMEISLGEQGECTNVIHLKAAVVRKQKTFLFQMHMSNWCRYSCICNLYLYFGPSLIASCWK